MDNFTGHVLNDWIPYRLKEEGGDIFCHWLYLGDERFDLPFFDETISNCRKLPENSSRRRIVSSLDMLHEWAPHVQALPPAAVIFHVSRCGSTLLSQLLATDPANIVLSEVPFFDELLRYGFRSNNLQTVLPLVKDAVSFYGAKREDSQEKLFIKADSWHIHFYKELRQLFPQTPFFLLYRRPDEVLKSQQKKRGMQAVPGLIEPGIFGFDTDAVIHSGLDEYMARVLEGYYSAFISVLQKDSEAFAFDYKEGMMTVLQQMMDVCKITISEKNAALMMERSSRHGKFPEQVFSEEKVSEPLPDFLQPAFTLYNELEKTRLTHRPTS